MSNDTKGAVQSGKPEWRAPTMTEDAIADATKNETNQPGDDGLDQFVGYETTGIKS